MISVILIVLLMVTLSFRGISGSVPGGWQPVDVSDNAELLKGLVEFAVKTTTDKKHEDSPYLIVSAQQQVRDSRHCVV